MPDQQQRFRIAGGLLMEPDDQRQQLESFGKLVLAERELHDRLRAVADTEAFVALTVQLGREHGLFFTAASVKAALREQRRVWRERWI